MTGEKVVAVVLAGGNGSRMNSDIPKQYTQIGDRELIFYCLDIFQKNEKIDGIILVTREEDISFCKKEIIDKYNITKCDKVVAGGRERYDSVASALSLISKKEVSLVMIHDGARPFVTDKMINDSIEAANDFGACTVAVPVKDTIKIVDENGFGINTPNRNTLYQIQTPQTFKTDLILSAYEKMKKDQNYNITDDTMVIELYEGVHSKIINGAYENIKITTKEDIIIAENFLKKMLKVF